MDQTHEKGLIGLELLQKGQTKEALNHLNDYLNDIERSNRELDSDDGIMYYNRALAKTALGDSQGAMEDLKTCIKYTRIHQAYFNLADLQVKKGEQQEGLNNLVKAYELGSEDAENALRKYTNYFDR